MAKNFSVGKVTEKVFFIASSAVLTILLVSLMGCDLLFGTADPEIRVEWVEEGYRHITSGDNVYCGEVDIGLSLDCTFQIKNEGEDWFKIQGVIISSTSGNVGFEVTQNPEGTLDPGKTSTLGIRFTPSSAVDYEAEVDIEIEDSDTFTFSISGKGVGTEGDDGGGETAALAPPSWIIGNWSAVSGNTYNFTSDDVIINDDSFKSWNNTYPDNPENWYTEGENSGTLYVVNVPGGIGYSYSFSNEGGDPSPGTMVVTITMIDSIDETATKQ